MFHNNGNGGGGDGSGFIKPAHPSLIKSLLEEGTEDYYKEDCPDCGAKLSFVREPDNLLEIPEKGISEILPTWICSECGYEALEEKEYSTIFTLMEKSEGRHYYKIELKDGIKHKVTIH